MENIATPICNEMFIWNIASVNRLAFVNCHWWRFVLLQIELGELQLTKKTNKSYRSNVRIDEKTQLNDDWLNLLNKFEWLWLVSACDGCLIVPISVWRFTEYFSNLYSFHPMSNFILFFRLFTTKFSVCFMAIWIS